MLRRAASGRFDVFVTADQNLQFQQNPTGSPLRIIVIAARSNTIEDLLPLMPLPSRAIDDVRTGEIRRVALSEA